MALRWADVDLANGVLHVERSYDPKAGEYVEPKSRSGRRRVPSLEYCATRSTPTGRRSPPTRSRPRLCSVNQGCRSMTTTCGAVLVQPAWQKAKLEPIGPYAARHTAASTMIAAGLNVKALSTFLGHASITHARPLRPPVARVDNGGDDAARRYPRAYWRTYWRTIGKTPANGRFSTS
jgi:integrase